jgi:hypothetical protein
MFALIPFFYSMRLVLLEGGDLSQMPSPTTRGTLAVIQRVPTLEVTSHLVVSPFMGQLALSKGSLVQPREPNGN